MGGIALSIPAPVMAQDFTRSQILAIRTVFGALGCVGLCGSIFVITSFLLFPHLRSFNKGLITCLAVADAMSAVGDIMSLGYYASPPLPFTYCNIQATLIQYSEMASFIWSLIIACYLYTSAVKNWPNSKTKSLLPLFLVLGFAIPLIPVIVIQVEKAIGNSTNGPDITWCWIRGEYPAFRLGFYYGPMALIWIINVILYILIVRKAFDADSSAFSKVVMRLSLFVLAAVIANFPALINRIQNVISPRHPVFALFLLHAIFNPLQGFCNAIVYSSSAPLRSAYVQLFRKFLCFCCPNPESDTPTLPYAHDDEEVAYEQYRQTLSEATSHLSGYFSADAVVRGTFETEPLLSGSHTRIQQDLDESYPAEDGFGSYGSYGS